MAESILHRIARGDKTAVQECLNKYGGLVWSLARRMSANTDDAEDAVQEIFIDVWKNAERFDEAQASETTFIAMIARRRLIDRLRYAKRRIAADSLEELVSEPQNRADEELQTSIEAKDAARALRQLRPEQRQVLQLSIVRGLSHQEISEATGIPLGTVKTHARRGLLQIRDLLGMSSINEAKGGTA
ncbi:MAG: sigma-70 family RNA polymerase sigma factor [Acidobacteria bacterium]|nr:sigma-70 family RNA polymerase sigma factor [Acidobacteriota bacterium]